MLLALVAITLGGGALRGVAAATPSTYQSADERAYAMIARSLSTRGTYGDPVQADPVHWPPGAPLLFAAAFELHPQTRGDGVWDVPAAYPLQAAVGTAVIPAAFLLAFVVAGARAGLAAATPVAFYPPLIEASGDLLSEPLGALLVTCALLAVAVALRRPAWWTFAGAGALLGASVLTRADLLAVPLIATAVVAAALWRRERPLAGVRAGVLTLAGCLVAVVPWSVFASLRNDAFVPVSSGGGTNFFVGTLLPAEGSVFRAKKLLADETRERFPRLRDEPAFRLPAARVMDAVAARRPGMARDAALQAEAIDNLERYALDSPVAFAGMMAHKVERLWLHYTTGTFGQERVWILAMHLAIVALGLGGLVAAAVRRRGGAALWLIGLTLLYMTALNAVLISEARHNLAVMPLVAVAGAAGLALGLEGAAWTRVIRRIASGATLRGRS